MVQLQILSKILETHEFSIVEDNFLTNDYFVGYEKEIQFIRDHIDKYGNVPDKATFLAQYPDFELVEVTESDNYLLDTVREEYLYHQSVPVIQKAAELLKTDSNAAAEYMMAQASKLQPSYQIGGVDIIAQSRQRFEEYKKRLENQGDSYFESGFQELDDITHGLKRGEELVVIVARTNQGKSWVIAKMCTHVWQIGFNVGYVSPEMTDVSIGYRFDTLNQHFSNKKLMWGTDKEPDSSYEKYIDELSSHVNKFVVATPANFGNQITVSKLRNWVKQNKLDLLAVDGIKYITDERGRKNDNITTTLTNVSEDLMSLSVELGIPILVVVQANRSGVVGNDGSGTPELESIRDSDGIAHNASKVLSIQQKKDNVLEIGVKKQRFGAVGDRVNYIWDIDTGVFEYMPSDNDGQPRERKKQDAERITKKYQTNTDVF